jgi:ribonuclease E
MSLIARTAGIGRSAAELQWDLNYMLKLWDAIDGASKAGKGAFLIYQESSLVIRAIRDYFTADIGEILIDTDDIFEQAQQFMNHVMPETASRVKRYRDDAPLFSRFQIEHQIETAFTRTVNLPSGGAIVIDHTEALVSVDVNSARSTRGSDIEETATRTNLEAADEIARQMRLRDLGGLIVVDFIDMEESKNRREVEQRLRDALRTDRARVQFSSISKFGLLELSRQRLRPALSEGNHITCPRCNGTGHIRDTESSALQILRMVQEESMKENTAAVHVQVPVEVTSFLLNEKRTEITKIELKQRVTVLLVPNKHLETPNYKLERLRHDDPRLEGLQASYTMIEEPDDEVGITRRRDASEKGRAKQEPVIKGVLPDQPAPPAPPPPPVRVAAPVAAAPATPAPLPAPAPAPAGSGFFGWIKRLLGGSPAPAPAVAAAAPAVDSASAMPVAAATGEKRDGRRGERGGRGGERGERGPRGGRGEGREGREGRESREGRENREGRNGRGPRAESAADATPAEREERAPRAEGRNEARGEGRGEPRGEGRSESRRGPRPERTPRAEDVTATAQGLAEAAPGTEAAADDADREGKGRRRRRGGRDRNEGRGEEGPVGAEGTALPQEAAAPTGSGNADGAPFESAPEAVAETGEREPRGRRRGGRGRDRERARDTGEGTAAAEVVTAEADSGETWTPAAAADVAPAEPVAAVAAWDEAPAVEMAPVAAEPVARAQAPERVAVPTAALSVAPPHAAEPIRIEPYRLPTDELRELAGSAGLEWVLSDAEKIRVVQEAMAAEPPPVRLPREPRRQVLVDEGPLVLVETKKDLSQLKLPFEASAG